MTPLRLAIVGFGKIAADQHRPAIDGNDRLQLAATVSRSESGPPPHFGSIEELLESKVDFDAVVVSTPPTVRYDIARQCIEAGLHVLLEKPPSATLGDIEELACLAEARDLTLFATWHARHNPAVAVAGELLAGRQIRSMKIVWHEDVEKWHPGQEWIWRPGGFGVFDPGINALSIATAIFPGELLIDWADLHFPVGSDTPIAADIALRSSASSGQMTCSFDWRRTEGEQWTIAVETEDGCAVTLDEGGARLFVDGVERPTGPSDGEYPDIYRRFVQLIDERHRDVDVRPLRLVADCFLLGRRHLLD